MGVVIPYEQFLLTALEMRCNQMIEDAALTRDYLMTLNAQKGSAPLLRLPDVPHRSLPDVPHRSRPHDRS